MPKKLIALKLEEVSLVDDPANQHAKVTLFKRNIEEKDMGEIEKLNKQIAELTTEKESLEKKLKDGEDVTKKLQASEKTLETLLKQVEEAGFEINKGKDGEITIKKSAEKEFVVIDGEKVEKGSVPIAVLKRLESLEKESNERILEKRAKEELPDLAGTDLTKGRLLAQIDKIEDEKERKELTEALKAANAAVKAVFKEHGHLPGYDDDSPQAQLDKMVEAYAKEHKVTDEKAYAEVTKSKDGKELLKAIRSEGN